MIVLSQRTALAAVAIVGFVGLAACPAVLHPLPAST